MNSPKKTLADAMRNAAANSMIPEGDVDSILLSHSQPSIHPAQQARNEALLAMSPKREDFTDEEEYLEAVSGFRHRIGPLLRPLPFVNGKVCPQPGALDSCDKGSL